MAPGQHHRPASAALRRGIAAIGITGSALTVAGFAIPVLPLAGSDLPAESDRRAPSGESPASQPAAAAVAPAPASPGRQGAASADLIKAVDRQRRAEAAKAAQAAEATHAQAEQRRTAATNCGIDNTYGGVADSVQTVGNALQCVFPDPDVIGVGGRSNPSDHPDGYALDFLTTRGDAVADCAAQNAEGLGVEYVIWNQRINTGSGWEQMEDRGGPTANHDNNVHLSFSRGGSPDLSALRDCGGAAGSVQGP